MILARIGFYEYINDKKKESSKKRTRRSKKSVASQNTVVKENVEKIPAAEAPAEEKVKIKKSNKDSKKEKWQKVYYFFI